MVHQAYLRRLALGRSAFEPPETLPVAAPNQDDDVEAADASDNSSSSEYVQAYNSRGHPQNPASRSLARRNIRAYNEVLSTVDVCARVDADGKPVLGVKDAAQNSEEQLESILEENEIGFWLSVDDEFLRMLTTTFTSNLRRRIQTFDFYGGISLITILRVELSRQGILQTFLAGQVATTVYALLFGAAAALIGEGREMLMKRFALSGQQRSQRRLTSMAITTGVRVLEWTSFCALLPLQMFAALQRLNLIPLWPLLPNPFSKSLFAIAIPPIPDTRNRQAIASWLMAFVTSPMMATVVMQFLGGALQPVIARYMRASMLRPDNPDQLTQRMMRYDALDDSSGILKYPRFQPSLREELQKDIEDFKQGLRNLRLQMRNTFRRLFFVKRPSVEFGGLGEGGSERDPAEVEPLPSLPSLPSLPTTVQPIADSLDSIPVTILPPVITEVPANGSSDSPLFTPTSSTEHEEPEDSSPSNVRIRTRTGSTSTLHLDVEISTSAELGATVHTSSFAASPHPAAAMNSAVTESSSAPYHRVTALSLYAADSMNVRMSGLMLTLIRLPLEAFYTRVVARNFLLSRDPQHWLLPHVYPSNCWFGIAAPYSNADYASKILLCLGTEAVITSQVWYLACKGAFWMGKRWYGWGKL